MWKNGACYIRVSTDDQTEYSPDAQLKAIKDYAKKNDIILTKEHIYADEGVSGKRADKRPAFMKMIATAKLKPKPFDIILVHKFDRFARSREDSVVYKSLLKKEAGIKVVSITESIEDDKFSVILEAMLEAMAEYYSLNLAEEVKKGMTEKAVRGGLQTCPPFGYSAINGKLEIVEEEAKYIQFIFNKFANHEMNILQLAKYMNNLGVQTHRGSKFENRTIEYILNNPVYIGKLRWTPTGRVRRNYSHPDTIIAEAEHQPIIDIPLWERVQEAIKNRKELYPKRQKQTTTILHWSKGLVKCGNCGKTLVVNVSKYYQCNGYAKGQCQISHSIKISVIEDLILEQLKETFKSNLEIKIVPKTSDNITNHEYSILMEKLDKLSIKEKRIKEAYQDGIDTKEEYRENKIRLKEEKTFLENQLEQMRNQLKNSDNSGETIIKKIESTYGLLTDNTIPIQVKYNTAHFLINQVIFNKQEKTLVIEYK